MLAIATAILLSVSACSVLPDATSQKGLSLEGQARQDYVAERIKGYYHPAAGWCCSFTGAAMSCLSPIFTGSGA